MLARGENFDMDSVLTAPRKERYRKEEASIADENLGAVSRGVDLVRPQVWWRTDGWLSRYERSKKFFLLM